MAKRLFPKGIIKIIDEDGVLRNAEYMGKQQGFECQICGKGDNCYTFNIFENEESYKKGEYETFAYGREHLDRIQVIE